MKQIIDAFLKDKKVAIAGVSRKGNSWGNNLMEEFKKLGYEVFPVNPNADEIEGVKCYRNVAALPNDVHGLVFATKPQATTLIAKEIPSSHIKRVWIQKGAGKGSYSEEAFQTLKENNIDIVYKLCPMMFFDGTGIHRFHYRMRKFFGGVPAGVA